MKAKYAPVMAVLVTLAITTGLLPGRAQLPPTNMGKYVHQPGDNQYSDQTQQSRHGGGPMQTVVPVQASVPSGYTPTPAPVRPDPTLDPIAADEPIPTAGFPPLPDRLDLGFGGASSNGGNWPSGGGGGAGGFGGYSGASPGMAGGGGGGAANPTFHQHYGHLPPGAFQQQQPGGGGGGFYKAASPPGGGGGGYRPATAPGADVYNASSPPAYTGATSSGFKALGKEPKLNDREPDSTQAPDAPTPVVVSQSATQDLSLPEDEFSYRNPNAAKNQMKRTMYRMIKAPLNSIGGVAGVRF